MSVDDFELLKIIGRGAFGEVRLCRERNSGTVYAMKTMRKAQLVEQGKVAHVWAERVAMAEASAADSAFVGAACPRRLASRGPPVPSVSMSCFITAITAHRLFGTRRWRRRVHSWSKRTALCMVCCRVSWSTEMASW